MQTFDKSLFYYVKFREEFNFRVSYGIPLAIPLRKKSKEAKQKEGKKKRKKGKI